MIISNLFPNPSLKEWKEIQQHLLCSLSTFLKREIFLEHLSIEDSIVDTSSMASVIYSAPLPNDAFSLGLEGRLGVELIGGKPETSAFLFLFSNGKRMSVLHHPEGSYFFLRYIEIEGVGKWEDMGWQEDIYGEFEDIDMFHFPL
ncbi:MAG: hypothetical protein ACPG8W_23635 [Candidatus Promineifilaceae bacterium]